MPVIENFLNSLISWFLTSGIKIVIIIVAAFIVIRLARTFIEKAVRRVIKKEEGEKDQTAERKREDTLISIFNGILMILVWGVVALTLLDELGVNLTGVLAGAGVVGIAVGFGAQYMIRDFLAGIFIIMENQYRVGDVVCLDDTCGLVQDIGLRKTILRDLDGKEHHIPNGTIKKSSNLSKDFARVNLNIRVAYKENLEKVIEVINNVGNELAEDSKFKDNIFKTPQVLGVDDFADSAIVIKVLGETKPLKQWDTARELRKRIKIAFDKERIEIPFPQMSVWQKGTWQ